MHIDQLWLPASCRQTYKWSARGLHRYNTRAPVDLGGKNVQMQLAFCTPPTVLPSIRAVRVSELRRRDRPKIENSTKGCWAGPTMYSISGSC